MKNTTARGAVPTPSGSIAEAAGQIAKPFWREIERSRFSIVSVLLCIACLSGCDRTPRQAPPRATDTIKVPPQTSTLDVPIVADLDKLAASLEQVVPRRLWSIDKPGQTCLPPRKVKILFAKIKTPAIQCRVTGTVVRGPLVLEGSGKTITVTMPLHAAISARDVGGVLSRETAEADARVRAVVRLDIARDWSPRATVSIAYDWTDEPHVDFLGQRIEFTSKADAKLAGVVARLERTLPQELGRLQLRQQVAQVWGSAFTSVQLNRANPPVWMRITPRQLSYGGYTISRNRVTLALGLTAVMETFVGDRPPDPQRRPLPDMTRTQPGPGRILFAIPVIADYRQLEPVLAKALIKRSRRPFEVPGVGAVRAQFHQVTIYGTTGGKIAVGLRFSAVAEPGEPSQGTIWLTATPRNAVNNRRVAFDDLNVAGVTDSVGTGLLLKLANAPGISSTVSAALTQNFENDYDKLLSKIARAIENKRVGNLVVRARISDIRTGRLSASGQGVYLPVWGMGTAAIELATD